MNKFMIFSIFIYLFGTFISAISQVLLKKSTQKEYKHWIREYLNLSVILAYGIFFLATLCTVVAYKYIPLSMGPILGTLEYIYVALLSYFLLKENISKRKLWGLIIIIFGVLIFSFDFSVLGGLFR